MMHEWSDFQWWYYFLTNWMTGVAYTYIPLHLATARKVAGNFGELNTKLFERFVFACGVHHFIHPVAMYCGYWWPIAVTDTLMCWVSVEAAIALWKAGRERLREPSE